MPIALLNLHRTYFAQALHDQPQDLLKHRYGPSVMATYRSAWRLIEGLKQPSKKTPKLLSRHSLAWSQNLSAAVRSFIHNCVGTWEPILRTLDRDVSACDPSAKFESGYLLFRGVGHGRAAIYTGCSDLPTGIE